MARKSLTLTLFFLILVRMYASGQKPNTFLMALEEKLENKLTDYAISLAKWLESFNDKHLGRSELGKLLHYEEIKPRIDEVVTGRKGHGMKKMGMAMLPMVFHVGATSTWMILTTILTAKSVAIGIALLVFKIAVSSAKVASFFTALKSKQSANHHGWSWSPHYEHHGHERSFSGIESHPPSLSLHSPYSHEWSPNDHPAEYHTIPSSYKDSSDHEKPHSPSLELPSYSPEWMHDEPVEYHAIPSSHKQYSDHDSSHPTIEARI